MEEEEEAQLVSLLEYAMSLRGGGELSFDSVVNEMVGRMEQVLFDKSMEDERSKKNTENVLGQLK